MNELKGRGVEDVLIAIVDGLKGFSEAITAVFPQAQVQTCLVHLIRNHPARPAEGRLPRCVRVWLVLASVQTPVFAPM